MKTYEISILGGEITFSYDVGSSGTITWQTSQSQDGWFTFNASNGVISVSCEAASGDNEKTMEIVLLIDNQQCASIGVHQEPSPLPPCGCEDITFEIVEPTDYSKEYFTIEAINNNTRVDVVLDVVLDNAQSDGLSYSLDDGETWSEYFQKYEPFDNIVLNSGEKVMFKGDIIIPGLGSEGEPWPYQYNVFNVSEDYKVSGNLLSLAYKDSFTSATYSSIAGFSHLFFNDSNLIDAENLVLPAYYSSLTFYTLDYMFMGCSMLVSAPSNLSYCSEYMFTNCSHLVNVPSPLGGSGKYMFSGCTSLTSAPSLIDEVVYNRGYEGMFAGCTSLTTAPQLQATTMRDSACTYMFSGCTSLTTAPQLPATTLGEDCYLGMFQGCYNLTTAPVLPATTLASRCYANMFDGCASLTSAPQLPATALAHECYAYMFEGCTSLTSAPQLTATTLAQTCYYHMFDGCTSLTTAQSVLPATTLESHCYAHMFNGCESLTSAPQLPATALDTYCYAYMFSGCTALTSVQSALPATTLAQGCYEYMFSGCKSLGVAPQLPAATLVDNCYENMFSDCTSLTAITCLATSISATDCTTDWVSGIGCSVWDEEEPYGCLCTFTKAASMSDWIEGDSGIPYDWTVVNYGS